MAGKSVVTTIATAIIQGGECMDSGLRTMSGQAHLVYENDGWGVLPSQTEQLTDKLLTFSHPLGNEITGGHSEEGGLCLCCDCLQTALHHRNLTNICEAGPCT